ncbi:MAG: response regulator [Anaerolineae bacterium]|nr:response regulator [Anaerolineae bacterium]
MDNAIRILLIEDNPGDAGLIRTMLLDHGSPEFALHRVETLHEAVLYSREQPADVILLDLSLPDSTGIDTLLKALTDIPDKAIIVLTGFDDQRLGVQAVQMGAQDYLVKDDIDSKLLRRAIRYAIERHRTETALRRSEEAYRSLIDDVFDTSMVAVIILNKSLETVWCNEAMEIYFGIERGQILGEDKRWLIDNKLKCIFADPDDYAARLFAAYDEETYMDRFECRVVPDFNRQERWLEHWSQPIRTGIFAGGRIEQYNDITDRKDLQFAEQEQRRFAEALRDTAAALSATLDLDEVLDRILVNVELVVPHDTASITLQEGVEVLVARHRTDIVLDTQEMEAENNLHLENIPMQYLAEKIDRVVIIEDLQTEPTFASAAKKANVHAYAGIPIRLEEKVIGFINLFAQKPAAFKAEDGARLEAFAAQSAIAIKNAQLYRQSQELAALEERQRLARDLHDSVSQTLFTCSVMAESSLRRWEKDPARARELMQEIHGLTITALSEMRILLLELRPEALTKVGLKQLFEQYLVPIQSRRGFNLIMEIDEVPALPPKVQIAFYRIAQEALNNVDKHANATQVTITVRNYHDHLELMIHDNGVGFNEATRNATSMGLNIMRERGEAINATLHIGSAIGQGTHMTLNWLKEDHQRDKTYERKSGD